MQALIKRTIVITLAALLFVVMGHLILDVTSDRIADNYSGSDNKSSVAINN